MRFMIQLWSDEHALPDTQLVAAMVSYNDALSRAGVLLAAEGLLSSSRGARISMSAGQRELSHGPFHEALGVCVGFWLLRVRSRAEALECTKRCPLSERDVLELRELYGVPDLTLAEPLEALML